MTRLLELSEPPRYERATGSKLDPHQGSIARMLDADPRVPATVIIEYLRRDGYEGGMTILKDYLVGFGPCSCRPGRISAPAICQVRWVTPTGGNRGSRCWWDAAQPGRCSGW